LWVNCRQVEPRGKSGHIRYAAKAEVSSVHLLHRHGPLRVMEPGNLIERLFNRIKQCRRHDKLALSYLASIRIWLRANEANL